MAPDDVKKTDTAGRLIDAVVCAYCGGSSGLNWRGWLAYRVDDPQSGRPPELGFYCPDCAGRKRSRRKTT